MEAALYDPERGFFARGRGAGRAGSDFVTSPQIGSLFGACLARGLDGLWRALDEPDPFLVVEAGAGNGRLARDILRAAPLLIFRGRAKVLRGDKSAIPSNKQVFIPTVIIKKDNVNDFIVKINRLRGRTK